MDTERRFSPGRIPGVRSTSLSWLPSFNLMQISENCQRIESSGSFSVYQQIGYDLVHYSTIAPLSAEDTILAYRFRYPVTCFGSFNFMVLLRSSISSSETSSFML